MGDVGRLTVRDGPGTEDDEEDMVAVELLLLTPDEATVAVAVAVAVGGEVREEDLDLETGVVVWGGSSAGSFICLLNKKKKTLMMIDR